MTDEAPDPGPPVGGDPAARLLDLLEAAKQLRNDTRLRDGWAQLLSVEDSQDLSTLLPRLGDVLRLPGQVRAAIETTTDDAEHDNLTVHLSAVEKLLLSHVNVTNSNVKWEKLRAGITDAMVVELRWVSRELQRAGPWPTARRGDVDRARTLVQEVVDELLAATDLDPAAGHVLLDHAQALREALERYQVAGAEAIVQAVERTVGAYRLRPSLVEGVPERLRTRLAAAAFAALELVQTGAAVAQLGAGQPEPAPAAVEIETLRVELALPVDAPPELVPAIAHDEVPDQDPRAEDADGLVDE